MIASIHQVHAPLDTLVAPIAAHAHYTDAFSLRVAAGTFPSVDALARACTRFPGWVRALMRLRNAVVAPFGLKVEPDPRAHERAREALGAGDRVGIFRVIERSTHELLLGENDKHLDFRFSLLLRDLADVQEVFATTTVHFHNVWGRLYFFFVAPVHRRIIPAMLRNTLTA